MTDDPVAVLLKFGFLAILYLFLLWVARSSLRDLARTEEGQLEVDHAEPPAESRGREPAGPDLRAGVQPQLEVVAALGHEPGERFDISEGVTMGRSANADINIDDPFASSAHLRIYPRGAFLYIEDMGSTNGTFLNGRQLRRPEQLKTADIVRVGDSEYRYAE